MHIKVTPRRDGLVVRVSASHAVGIGFAPGVKGRVVCETVYRDMHYKYIL